MQPLVTILICTRNRADSLRSSLESIRETHISAEMPTEIVVVDNGSNDNTGDVIRSIGLSSSPVRSVLEDRPGKSNAYNAGVRAAAGRILLSTDDDVRVPTDWIGPMCRPILEGKADVVQGSIVPATHLERPWLHSAFLAVSATVLPQKTPDGEINCVGANLAFSRSVADAVRGFDPMLGPGSAAGLCEDILFGAMAREAGFRVIYAAGLPVIHHFDSSRLTALGVLDVARRMGRSLAFMDYHWSHSEKKSPAASRLILEGKLAIRSMLSPRGESIPQWQFCYERELAYQKQLIALEGQERRYALHAAQAVLANAPF